MKSINIILVSVKMFAEKSKHYEIKKVFDDSFNAHACFCDV